MRKLTTSVIATVVMMGLLAAPAWAEQPLKVSPEKQRLVLSAAFAKTQLRGSPYVTGQIHKLMRRGYVDRCLMRSWQTRGGKQYSDALFTPGAPQVIKPSAEPAFDMQVRRYLDGGMRLYYVAGRKALPNGTIEVRAYYPKGKLMERVEARRGNWTFRDKQGQIVRRGQLGELYGLAWAKPSSEQVAELKRVTGVSDIRTLTDLGRVETNF